MALSFQASDELRTLSPLKTTNRIIILVLVGL
jgi:hypothetical protein